MMVMVMCMALKVVAGNQELGADYEHVQMLEERFQQFARDVESIGTERVASANDACDALIATAHTDSPTIALWKDSLNEAWENLLELMDTRTQMLEASKRLHRFFHDCRDCLARILEKTHAIPDELGRDSSSVSALQRKHAAFQKDLEALEAAVKGIQAEAGDLQAAYAGDKAREIAAREAEVLSAWRQLQGICDGRGAKLNDTSELFRFMTLVRDLLLWMDGVKREMNTQERPKYASSSSPFQSPVVSVDGVQGRERGGAADEQPPVAQGGDRRPGGELPDVHQPRALPPRPRPLRLLRDREEAHQAHPGAGRDDAPLGGPLGVPAAQYRPLRTSFTRLKMGRDLA